MIFINRPKSLWNQNLDGATQQITATVSEKLFDLRICLYNASLVIDHHDRIRRRSKQFLEKRLSIQALSFARYFHRPPTDVPGPRLSRIMRHDRFNIVNRWLAS